MTTIIPLSRIEVARIRKLGKRTHLPIADVRMMVEEKASATKLLVITPKKIMPNAADRNRARRITTEAVRIVGNMQSKPVAVVIQLKQPLRELKTQDMVTLLTPLFQQ